MTNRKTTGAWIGSMIALILCCAMLVGSTFAWFTDSASTAVNQIQSGTLDVDIVKDGTTTSLDGTTLKFADRDDILWEPGCTYNLEPIQIVNKGNLALQYKIVVNGLQGDAKLLEALEWTVTVDGVRHALDELNGELRPLSATGTIVLSAHMKEEAGNEYQGLKISGLGITVYATQVPYETDSYGPQYDQNALLKTDYRVVYIYNLEDFTAFGKAVNTNGTYCGVPVANNAKVWVEIMDDIDMTDAPAIQGTEFSIGNGNDLKFCGVIDGNGHTIRNYHITGSWAYNVSLFRTVSGDFTMKDIVFEDCSASKPNNRGTGLIVGTIGGGTIIFDNVDLKNCQISSFASASGYVSKMTEGALYFINCDVLDTTLTASSAQGTVGMFLGDGYSHHDYAESGVFVKDCTMINCTATVNGTALSTIPEYIYTK